MEGIYKKISNIYDPPFCYNKKIDNVFTNWSRIHGTKGMYFSFLYIPCLIADNMVEIEWNFRIIKF